MFFAYLRFSLYQTPFLKFYFIFFSVKKRKKKKRELEDQKVSRIKKKSHTRVGFLNENHLHK